MSIADGILTGCWDEHDRPRYRRLRDGALAIVASVNTARGLVYYRREEEGELLRVSTSEFAKLYGRES